MAKNKKKKKGGRKSQEPLEAANLSQMTWRDTAMEWIRAIVVAIILALLIRWPLVEPFKIPSGSMRPTLYEGDRIFVNKFVYGVRFPFNGFRIPFTTKSTWYTDHRIWRGAEPKRWEVVVFKSVEPNAEHDILVKRIVGLPGERIHVANGKIHVNGEALELPDFVPDIYYTSGYGMDYGVLQDDAHAIVPEGHVLLFGDNSMHSRDGRVFGWMPQEHLLGRVFAIWWPVTRWRDLTGFTDTWWWNTALAVLALLTFVRLFLGRFVNIPHKALGGTFARGEHVFINRIAFGLPLPFTRIRLTGGRKPERGEIVLCHCQDNAGNRGIILARVAGLGGEQVFMENGTIQIDGARLEEPAALAEIDFSTDNGTGPYGRSKSKEYSRVPENHYFVLVDDTEESLDSRALGWIAHKDIIGAASFVWWPPMRARRVSS